VSFISSSYTNFPNYFFDKAHERIFEKGLIHATKGLLRDESDLRLFVKNLEDDRAIDLWAVGELLFVRSALTSDCSIRLLLVSSSSHTSSFYAALASISCLDLKIILF